MAHLLWGKVYYKDVFAGILREEPGDRVTFTYDPGYIIDAHPAIAYTLPLQSEPHISQHGLHSFFDNLVSEGWLEQAQSRLLGRRRVSRFELLLAFGFDCAGAVSILDPEPSKFSHVMIDMEDPKEIALLTSRASLSGVQPKIAAVEENGIFRPSHTDELSTHIAKFPSSNHPDLLENEYLTTRAFKALLPDDDIVDLDIQTIQGFEDPALLIKRFDRKKHERVHFEEFNQLLGNAAREKYEGSHKNMADFMQNSPKCSHTQVYRLYRRILAGILLGNTDMHLKNFALFHDEEGFRLTPSYDQVSAALYHYKTLALIIAQSKDHPIGNLKARHLIVLGQEFGLSKDIIQSIIQEFHQTLADAKETIYGAPLGELDFKEMLIKLMDKRWNGIFKFIGEALSKKL